MPFRLSPGGDAIMVPSGDALRLRMALAEEGMPVGGTVGYELLDDASPFTTSDFLANVNLRRAVEGELPGPSARCAASAPPACTSWRRNAPCSAVPRWRRLPRSS